MRVILKPRLWLALCLAFTATAILPAGYVLADSPSPQILAYTPTEASNDFQTEVELTGLNFDGDGVNGPRVMINDILLEDDKVEWADSTLLRLQFPWGLDPGVYQIRVYNDIDNPASASNPVDFTVSQGLGINQISQNHLYGGSINSVVFDPLDASFQTLYASAERVGIFKSIDGGVHWNKIFSENGLNTVLADPVTPNRLYSGREDEGLYRSDNGGASWTPILIPGDSINISTYQRPFVAPNGSLYSAMQYDKPDNSLRVSTNAGLTWQLVPFPAEETTRFWVRALAFNPLDSQIFFAGTAEGKVYKTVNSGQSWLPLGTPGADCVDISNLILHPVNFNILYAACGAGNAGLYRYDGSSWSLVDLTVGDGVHDPIKVNYATDLYINPANPQQMRVASWRGGYSLNGGTTWIENGPYERGTNAMAVKPGDFNTLFYGGGFGLFKTTDNGIAWAESVDGIDGVVAEFMAVDPFNPRNVYVTHDNGLYKSSDGALTWKLLGKGWWGPVAVDPLLPNTVYQVNGGLRRSLDGGDTFTLFPLPKLAGYEDETRYTYRYNHLVVAPSVEGGGMPVMMMTGSIADNSILQYPKMYILGVIYRSLDRGETWEIVKVLENHRDIKALDYAAADPQVFFAGGAEWVGDQSYLRMYISQDAGDTWSVLPNYGEVPGEPMENLAVNPATSEVMTNYGNALRSSTDQGQTWGNRRSPNAGNNVWYSQLLYTPDANPYLYIATSRGLFRTIDNTRTWQWFARGLGRNYIGAIGLASQNGNHTLYVSTSGGFATAGIQRLDTGERDEATVPVQAGLYRLSTPGALNLTSPENTSILPWESLTPGKTTYQERLQWEQVPAAERYEVQLASNSRFSSAKTFKIAGFANYSREVTKLKGGVTYYWRVRYSVDGTISPWSKVFSFTVPKLPKAPELHSPANKFAGSTATPLLKWKAVRNNPPVTLYHVLVDDSPAFDSPEVNEFVVASTGASYQVPTPLSELTRYSWKVQACIIGMIRSPELRGFDDRDCGRWSKTRTFTTSPRQVTLLSPGSGASVTQPRPAFSWSSAAAQGTGRYQIVISRSPAFSRPLVNATVSDQDASTPDVIEYAPPKNLPAGVTLYWRVRPQANFVPLFWGLWSESGHFQIQ